MRFSKDEVIALKKKALDIRDYCLSNSGCNDCCFLKGGVKSCMINTNPRGWKEDWSADEKRNCSQCKYHYDIIDPKTNRWQAYFCNKQNKVTSHSQNYCSTVCWDFKDMNETEGEKK